MTDEYANVYFTANVYSSKREGEDLKLNCILMLKWDMKKAEYQPQDEIIITPVVPTYTNTDVGDPDKNPLMSFKGIQPLGAKESAAAETFVKNFYTLLYQGQDVSTYYKGKSRYQSIEKDSKLVGISDFVLYPKENKSGFNATVNVSVLLTDGMTVRTKHYLKISRNGELFAVERSL